MIAIGNVKLGMRIEPIYVQRLSREEVNSILEEQGISINSDIAYPLDTRLISAFRTDKQRLEEYIEICKYVFDKKNGINTEKPSANKFSIFDDDLQINYELKHMKESESLKDSEKVEIYRQAKATHALFKMFGASNINLEINFLDRAYFEVQSLIQSIKSRRKVPALPSGKPKKQGNFRQELFDETAKEATERISETWKEEKTEKREEELTKN